MLNETTNTARPSAVCPTCQGTFIQSRRDKKFCSDRCRKSQHQKTERQKTPQNSKFSPSKKRENTESFDTALRLAEMYYCLPPDQRLGFVKDLVDLARSERGKLRHILTNQMLLNPPRGKTYLFYRGQPKVHGTIAQIADRYCRRFWGAGVRDVASGRAPEPETGEVIENVLTISIGPRADPIFVHWPASDQPPMQDDRSASDGTSMPWLATGSTERTIVSASS